jgi:hypothetical protein
MKKNTLSKILLIAIVFGFFSQCKKGKDDPFISLRTRKDRMAGEWTLKSGTFDSKYTSTNYSSSTYVSFTSSTYNLTNSSTNNNITITNTETGTYSYKLLIEKDGFFRMTQVVDGDLIITSGNWNFTAGIGDLKNKEQIVLNVTSESDPSGSTVYQGNRTNYTFNIRELRHKKLVIYLSEIGTSTSSTEQHLEEYTFEQ